MTGLSALLLASATLFDVVKLAGAAYLIFLGISRLVKRAAPTERRVERASLRRVYGQGFVVNLLNPKTALFFVAFFPQFVAAGRARRCTDPRARSRVRRARLDQRFHLRVGLGHARPTHPCPRHHARPAPAVERPRAHLSRRRRGHHPPACTRDVIMHVVSPLGWSRQAPSRGMTLPSARDARTSERGVGDELFECFQADVFAEVGRHERRRAARRTGGRAGHRRQVRRRHQGAIRALVRQLPAQRHRLSGGDLSAEGRVGHSIVAARSVLQQQRALPLEDIMSWQDEVRTVAGK